MSLAWLSRISFPSAIFGMSRRFHGILRPADLLQRRRQRSAVPLSGGSECDALKPAMTAPDFTLPRVGRGECSLSDYRGRRVLLAFVRLGCRVCREIVPKLNRLQRHRELQGLAIHRGRQHEAALSADDVLARFPVLVQSGLDNATQYQVPATPFAFVVNEQGRLVSSGGELRGA